MLHRQADSPPRIAQLPSESRVTSLWAPRQLDAFSPMPAIKVGLIGGGGTASAVVARGGAIACPTARPGDRVVDLPQRPASRRDRSPYWFRAV
jgi:hypothetical protein